MKYKVLLTGNNRMIINEFFTYMDFSFDCISTSDRFDDIVNHIKFVRPDVFVYCLYEERADDLKRFANVERKLAENGIPIVVIGSASDCTEFSRIAPFTRVHMLQKPISAQNIERSIIELMQERENVRTEPEEGFLETSEASETEAEEAEGMPPEPEKAVEEPARKQHILIIDDDSSVLKLIQSYLTGRYEVATAISGKIALKFLERRETDLILLDYEMPEENGAVILSKLRANEKTKDLPVVFLTGVSDVKKIREVLAMKPQGYLLKPIDMERLSSTIKGILS